MSSVDLCIRNAKIPRDGSPVKAGVAIEDGKIHSVSKGPGLPEADEEIDLGGSVLLPGVVDPHVHFRDPGLTHKEDFASGSRAAAAGGVTTVCDMPNTSPPTDSPKTFEEKREIAEKKSHVDFGLHGMVSDSAQESRKLADAGAVSLKLYPERCPEDVISSFSGGDFLLTVHPEDPELLSEMEESGDGVDAFLSSRPREAEISEIEKILGMASDLDVHFCHVTLGDSLDLITPARAGNGATCEVTPHHLLLDESSLREKGAVSKVHPPLRTPGDRRALVKALEDGRIDIVATDHAPHTREEKDRGMREAPPGLVGVETSLPLIFSLVQEGKLSLSRLVESMCRRPAEIFGLRNEEGILKGRIQEGADADLVAVDQDRRWEIEGDDLHGRTKFTPFDGREVTGKPFLTLVRGKIVYREGEILGGRGHGRFVPGKR